MSGGRAGGGRPRLVRVALFGLFRFCHPLRHDVLCSTWMGPGDRRYELRWIPSSPRSKGKPSSRILKMDFACLPPHPPRQGKAKFPDITLGLVLERGGRGACSGTALCLSMVPPGRKSVFRAGFRGVRSAPLPGGGTGGMNNSIGYLILSAPRLSPLPRRPPFPHQGTTKFSKLKLGFEPLLPERQAKFPELKLG